MYIYTNLKPLYFNEDNAFPGKQHNFLKTEMKKREINEKLLQF